MDMFQPNTFPDGGITMKTQDSSGTASGRITIGRLQSCSLGFSPLCLSDSEKQDESSRKNSYMTILAR